MGLSYFVEFYVNNEIVENMILYGNERIFENVLFYEIEMLYGI